MQDLYKKVMYFKKKSIFVFFLVLFLIIPLTYSQPPFAEEQDNVFLNGFVIDHPDFYYYPSNSQIGFVFHVYNISNGVMMTNETIGCEAHVVNSTGYEIFNIEDITTLDDKKGAFFANTSHLGFSEGYYGWEIHCNQSDIFGGYASGNFEVTKTGKEEIESTSILFGYNESIILYFALLLALMMFAIGLWKQDITLISIAGILLMISGIFISIQGFQLFNNLLTQAIAISLIGVGAYIFIRANLEFFGEIF